MRIVNRQANHEYTILDRFEAGVALTGAEVKSLRLGRSKLETAFVKIANGQPLLVNAEIAPYSFASQEGYDSKRTRKLLLHKREVLKIMGKMASSRLTVIPLAWYTTGHRVKLEIGLARGKKEFEKREILKKQDQKRELERDFRGKVK